MEKNTSVEHFLFSKKKIFLKWPEKDSRQKNIFKNFKNFAKSKIWDFSQIWKICTFKNFKISKSEYQPRPLPLIIKINPFGFEI